MADRFLPVETDHEIQDLISHLKFLSKIRPGEKLNIMGMTLIENTWINRLKRTVNGNESREKTFNFISRTVESSLVWAQRQIQRGGSEREVGKLIIAHLNECRRGISSLIETYEEDGMFTSRLETFMKILDTKLREVEGRLKKVEEAVM